MADCTVAHGWGVAELGPARAEPSYVPCGIALATQSQVWQWLSIVPWGNVVQRGGKAEWRRAKLRHGKAKPSVATAELCVARHS